jgi:hypothetical protein
MSIQIMEEKEEKLNCYPQICRTPASWQRGRPQRAIHSRISAKEHTRSGDGLSGAWYESSGKGVEAKASRSPGMCACAGKPAIP